MAGIEKDHAETYEAMPVENTQGVVLYGEDGQPRNIPVPSSDPNDPLNFGIYRQRLIFTVICVYGITGFGIVQATPLFFPNLIREYLKQTHGSFDPARISDFASYPSLCMGLGNFLFVPLSMAVGRRCAMLLSNMILLGSVIWAANSTSFESHLGARCLQGLTAGIAECLLPIIILDISFLHKRSPRLVGYWTLTAVGSSLLLVSVPFVIDRAHGNWRVGYWFWVAFAALSLVLVIFCFPETLFRRHAASISGRIHATDSYGTYRTFTTFEEAQVAGFNVRDDGDSSGAPPAQQSYASQLIPIRIQKPDPIIRFFNTYKDILLCILVPGTFWALALNSILFGGIVVLSLTYSQRLEMEPWHFSPSTTGTVQIGSAVGALVAIPIGAMAEPISAYLTRRNKGIREPEHVLPNFIFPASLSFAGLALYGVVGAHPEKYSWIGIHAAFALFYCGFCATSALTGVWLGELLPHMSGPAIVLTCGGRNAISFAYSSSFNRWVMDMGFLGTHVLFGGILFFMASLALPLYYMNGSIRKAMQSQRWLRLH